MSDDARRQGSAHSWESPHDRAQALLGERFTETVDAADVAWLEEHLAGCVPCREVDAAYRADRRELRSLRVPEPPRDLWARTSAAIEAERQRRPGRNASRARRAGSGAGRRSLGLTPQVLLGLTAAVIGVFLVGSMLEPSVQPPDVAIGSPLTPSGSSGLAGLATPIAISAGDVAWSVRASDGTYTLQEAPVNEVCPTGATADCSPIDAHSQGVAAIPVTPKSVYASAAMHQFVVLGRQAGSDGVGLYVVSVGAPGSSPSPSPAIRTPAPPSAPASASPSDGSTSSQAPSASPSASATAPASPPASSLPSGSPAAAPSGSVSPASAVPSPSASASVPSPTPAASAPVTPASLPPGTPAPTAAAVIAIASGLTVLGDSASYSPDGTWFAFSARSDRDSDGSDIYVWHTGADRAVPATTDHRSTYSGWAGRRILGSRVAAPAASASSKELEATSFLVDPATLDEAPLAAPAWRPVVDPTGSYVVYWTGTVVPDPSTGGWMTGTGRLVLAPWSKLSGAADASRRSPASSGSPVPETSAAASAAGIEPIDLPSDIGSATGVDWSVRWDETGSHLAIWVADRADPTLGHLALVTIDRQTGLADPTGPTLRDRPALPGFELGDGHLAWATPPGQDGQGSTLQVYAWSGPQAGQISSQAAGGSDPVIVVQH